MLKKQKLLRILPIAILVVILGLSQNPTINKSANADSPATSDGRNVTANNTNENSNIKTETDDKPKPAAAAQQNHASSPAVAQQSGSKTPAASPAIAPKSSDTYQVFDNFDGSALNSSLWQTDSLPAGYRNHEEQDYNPGQVSVGGGYLQLNAVRDGTAWHSGAVHSKWSYTYGEFEVRMALSTTGQGVWPAAWLMGTSNNWPDNGEIDMMENINGESTVYGTIHGGGTMYHWQMQKSVSGIDVTKFNVYKIVKTPGVISWWVNGVKYAEWNQSQVPSGGVWPYESHQNYALLNLAIGGDWPGASSGATPGNIVMYVDYFSVKNGS